MAAQQDWFAANAPQATSPPPQEDWFAKNAPTAPAKAEQEGFWHSLGAQFGVTPEAAQQAVQNMKDHPVKTLLLDAVGGPATPLVEGAVEGAKRSGGELLQASKDAFNRNRAGAAYHAIKAVPIVGSGMDKAADQYAEGNTAGELGTLVGTAAQAAPMVLGAADAAGVPRPNSSLPNMMSKFPTREGAGEIFNKLNTDLAQQPVALDKSAAPLQRAIEIGARGGTLPGPVAALLQRFQAIEPMTFPEARDYQASLSDLSASDKMAMNGRMRGAVAQLNHALYQDIRQSAEAGGGYGADFDNAMTEYRRASTAREVAQKAGNLAVKAAIGGGATAAGYGLIKDAMGK